MVGSVTADNCAAGTLTYKWFRVEGSSETSLTDGSKYTGTGALTLNILDAVPADAGTYRLKATCSGTQCTGVADAVLSVNPLPAVSATGAEVCAGNTAQMIGSVTADNCAGGTLTYKWFRVEGSSETSLTDGSKYTGTGTLTLNILDAVPADAGTYRLKATCSGTQCTGVADAVLSVNPVLVITGLSGQTACEGGKATFTVEPINGASYQWQMKQGSGAWTDVGTNLNSYETPVLTASDNGNQYQVIVTQAPCAATAGPATLTVNPPLVITGLSDQTACEGGKATFTVEPINGASYQWYKDGIALSDSTGGSTHIVGSATAVLQINGVTDADLGSYTVKVSSTGFCLTTSGAATLKLNPGISITVQPQSASGYIGDDAQFSVTAAGTGLTYQWYKVGDTDVALTDGVQASGATISGAATATLKHNRHNDLRCRQL